MRIYHILKNLTRSHEVTVVTYGSSEDKRNLEKNFDGSLKAVHVLPPTWAKSWRRLGQLWSLWTRHSYIRTCAFSKGMQEKLDRILSEEAFDIVQTEYAMMGFFDLKTDAIKIIDATDIGHLFFRQMVETSSTPLRKLYYRREFARQFREEIDVFGKQNAIFTTSMNDKDALEPFVPNVPKFVVPNGVDTSYFTPSATMPEQWSLVFTAAMTYSPNADGIMYFLDEIFPAIQRQIPAAKIYVVGTGPPMRLRRRASESVIVTGSVGDVRPYVWRSSVFVVPLRVGSGTRLKVLEAMSMKKPVVSTTIGAEGIDVADGESVLIADTPQAFADAVVGLLRDSAMREKLIRNGSDLVNLKYDWSVIGRRAEEIYASVLDGVNARRTTT
jgi:glycosyltransferase involved in cell wall biosynthesis